MEEKKCKFCEMKSLTKRGYKWRSNGTIGKEEGLLAMLIGEDELKNVFDSIEKKFNRPIDKLIILAKRIVTVNVENSEFLGRFMRLLTRLGLVSKNRAKDALNDNLIKAVGWGFCEKFEEFSYKEKKVVGTFKNYPTSSLIAGGVSGTIQFLFGLNSVDISQEENNGVLKMTITAKEKESELAKYIPQPTLSSKLNLLPGNISYDYCSRCDTPREVGDLYEWKLDKGKIIDKRTGKYYLLFTRYAIEVILGLIIRELGDEVRKIIFEAEKKYIKDNFSNQRNLTGTVEDYKVLLDQKEIGLKGWGNVVDIKKENKNLIVRVNNSFYEPIFSGMIGGYYEAIEGIEVDVKWEKNKEGFSIFRVYPK